MYPIDKLHFGQRHLVQVGSSARAWQFYRKVCFTLTAILWTLPYHAEMTHNETLTDDELRQLWTIKKHYDARLPEDVRKVYIPEKLASEASQRWLVENLIQSEATFLRAYEEEVPRGFSLGAVLWRKAFWKRIISHLEGEIAASPGEDVSDTYPSSKQVLTIVLTLICRMRLMRRSYSV